MEAVSDKELAELSTLLNQATPAPWSRGCLLSAKVRNAIQTDARAGVLVTEKADTDLDLVTLSRDLLPAILDEITYWRSLHGTPESIEQR